MLGDDRLIIRYINKEYPVSFASCQAVLKDHFLLRRVASPVFPKVINSLQKQQIIRVAQEILLQCNAFQNPILTCDQSLIYTLDTEAA